jgi:hypothetical protein
MINFLESITGYSKLRRKNLRQLNGVHNASGKYLNYKEATPVRLQTENKPKLPDSVRRELRAQYYGSKMDRANLSKSKRFILSGKIQHPQQMPNEEIKQLVNYFFVQIHISSSTQNQAL